MEKRQTTLWQDVRASMQLLKLAHVSPRYFAFVTMLALVVTVLSTYSIGILLPLAHGIITGSFDRVAALPGVSHLAQHISWFGSSTPRLLLLLLIALYVVTLVRSGAQYYAQLHAQRQAKLATVQIRSKVLHACLHAGRHFYDSHPVSTVHHTFMRLPQVLETQFRVLQRFATQGILILVYTALMFYISWQLALIVVFVVPITMLVSYAMIQRVRAAAFTSEEGSTALGSSLLDILLRMFVVQGFAKEHKELNRFAALSDTEVEEQFAVKRLTNLIEPLDELGTTTAVLFVALGMAALLHQGYALDAASLLVFFFIALQVLRSSATINSLRIQIASAEPLLNQLHTVLDAEVAHAVPQGTDTLSAITDEIRVSHVSYTYPGQTRAVLTDVSFVLPKGKVVALVGATGSGKSTIGNILLRMYDCTPETIFIDGKDIRTYTTASIRNRMSVVYQDPLLFVNSFEHNALYATDTTEQFEHMINRLCLSDVYQRTAEYGTSVDVSNTLSGGQRRLVSVIRAALRDHDFLLLDEATNSLDAQTEQQVLDTLFEQSKDKITLMISHRLSAIKRADHILFLHDGVIAEEGTYEELMQRDGLFAALWK